MFIAIRDYRDDWVDHKVHEQAYNSFVTLLDMLTKLYLNPSILNGGYHSTFFAALIHHRYVNKYIDY